MDDPYAQSLLSKKAFSKITFLLIQSSVLDKLLKEQLLGIPNLDGVSLLLRDLLNSQFYDAVRFIQPHAAYQS